MRKLIVPVGFLVATTALACSFHMGTGGSSPPPATAANAPPATQTPAATPAPAPTPTPPKPGTSYISRMGHVRLPSAAVRPVPGAAPTATAPAAPSASGAPAVTPPSGVAIMSGSNPFGSGSYDAAGFKGLLYAIPESTTSMPDFQSLAPTGMFFAKELNVAPQQLTGGFPGIDPNRNQYFGIEYEAPLVVENEADYDLRVSSDDGAIVLIDGTKIVDNDGKHGVQSKTGPVHLVRGTHVLTVQYFQTDGQVALQLYCKRAGQEEKICPLTL